MIDLCIIMDELYCIEHDIIALSLHVKQQVISLCFF